MARKEFMTERNSYLNIYNEKSTNIGKGKVGQMISGAVNEVFRLPTGHIYLFMHSDANQAEIAAFSHHAEACEGIDSIQIFPIFQFQGNSPFVPPHPVTLPVEVITTENVAICNSCGGKEIQSKSIKAGEQHIISRKVYDRTE